MGESVPIRPWKRLLCVGPGVAVPVSFGVAHAIDCPAVQWCAKTTDVISRTAFGSSPRARERPRPFGGRAVLDAARAGAQGIVAPRRPRCTAVLEGRDVPLRRSSPRRDDSASPQVSANTSYDIPQGGARRVPQRREEPCHLERRVLPPAVGGACRDRPGRVRPGPVRRSEGARRRHDIPHHPRDAARRHRQRGEDSGH